jgi:hypothetical protein
MTLGNPQLGAPAFEVVQLSLTYVWPEGWVIRSVGRRSGSTDWESSCYTALATEEVLDVVIHDLELSLGV